MKPENVRVLRSTDADSVRYLVIHVKDIKTHPTFANLLRIDPVMREEITQSMRANGFFPSNPITMGTWPGQDKPVVIDGHTRRDAALEAGIEMVPVVIFAFEDVMAALERAVSLQAQRRASTDGAYYRMCETYDTLMPRGGDRRSEEAKSMLKRVSIDGGRSASARMTAKLIGCHFSKVDKIRKIRRDGWPEIQEAVANDEMKIHTAYKLIRDMELGEAEEKSTRKLSAAQVKVMKSVLSEENFAALEVMGDDLGFLLNLAVEQFTTVLQEKEHGKIPEAVARRSLRTGAAHARTTV